MRKIIGVLVCAIILLLAAYVAFRGYEKWKQNHWMALARTYAEKGDAHNERLCLDQAIASNSRNPEAWRMLANLAEISHSTNALAYRKIVAQLDPGFDPTNSFTDQLALARTAVLLHDISTATNALAGVDPGKRETPQYLGVAGVVCLSLNKPQEAESDFAQAARLDPSNLSPQMSLAAIELDQTNTLELNEARMSLKRIISISTNAAVRAQACRELIADALRYKDNATALAFSKDLVQQTNALFSDKLLRLDVLRMSKSDAFSSALAAREREALTSPDEINALTLWLLERNMPSQALGWLRTLPANIQTNLPVALFEARCQILLQDWTGLQNSLSKKNWGRLDFARHAYVAFALRQQGLYQASKAEWDIARESANGHDSDLAALFRMAAQWHWPDETQQVLWDVVHIFPRDIWAGQQLAAILYATGATRPLMQLYSIQADRNSSDLDAKNNLALTAMLLSAQEMNPYTLARQVYDSAPTNAFYACTYAFALHLQGKNAQALKIMQKLDPQYMYNNSTAGYYGIILKAAGDKANARAYLNRSIKGQLLPEERALFQNAMVGL